MYQSWIDNMLSNVNAYYLVIYTNRESQHMVSKYADNPRIRIVIKELDELYHYKYKTNWMNNHDFNTTIQSRTCWEVNMLWAEKIWFVKQTVRDNPFGIIPDWYGWCDIGYFRPYSIDPRYTVLSKEELANWPSENKLAALDKTKIHYGLVNDYIIDLIKLVKNKTPSGLPETPIPPNQISIAGGFFMTTLENLDWWAETFDTRLQLYFGHQYLVKDDQMIIIDCILSNNSRFKMHRFDSIKYDNWFMFQQLLLD
jgi:hypothetical protein